MVVSLLTTSLPGSCELFLTFEASYVEMPPVWVCWFHDGVVVSSSSTPLPVWTPWPVRVPPIGFGPVISTESGSGPRVVTDVRPVTAEPCRNVRTAAGQVHAVQVARGRGGEGQGDPALAGDLLDAEDVAGGGVDVVVAAASGVAPVGGRGHRDQPGQHAGAASASRRARAAPGRCRPPPARRSPAPARPGAVAVVETVSPG